MPDGPQVTDAHTPVIDMTELWQESMIRQLYRALLGRPAGPDDLVHKKSLIRDHGVDTAIEKISRVLTSSTEYKMRLSKELMDRVVANARVREIVDVTRLLVDLGTAAEQVPYFEMLAVEHSNWKARFAFVEAAGRALHVGQRRWVPASRVGDRLTLEGAEAPGATARETFVLKNNRYQLDTEALAADRLADAATAAAWAHRRLHDGVAYRAPTDLEVAPTKLRRIMLVGACLLESWNQMFDHLEPSCVCERVLFNNIQTLPPLPNQPLADYDFQMVVLPFRSILPEQAYFRLNFDDDAAYERLFAESCSRIALFLPQALRWNIEHSLLTFVGNFFVPQQNPMGRLLPRYSLKNPVYFVERLNEFLAGQIAGLTNCYLLDLDQISATIGRKAVQDDSVWVTSHGSTLSDWDHRLDRARLEPVDSLSSLFTSRVEDFVFAVWHELKAMFRTVRQADQVKLVVMDLDDTMWRGVLAEADTISTVAIEGWPLGVAEALMYLRRRGVLIAIVSKNEEATIRGLWDRIFGGRIRLEDFAFVAINWRPKADNIREIIRQANVLPNSVVFVDDNPVERAAVQSGVPGVRAIGQNQHYIKRILLWSPETQLASISRESANRTELIQKQQHREAARETMTRADFLLGLDLTVECFDVASVRDPSFERAFELLNKTNQFNTTGQRWTRDELGRAIADGLRLLAFAVRDVHVEYGLVGLILHDASSIRQFVMSCRVFGLDVEAAVLSSLVAELRAQDPARPLSATLTHTKSNMPCRAVYETAGFVGDGDRWTLAADQSPSIPAHVRLTRRELVTA